MLVNHIILYFLMGYQNFPTLKIILMSLFIEYVKLKSK